MVDNTLDPNLSYDVIVIARKKFLELSYKDNFEGFKKDINKIFMKGEK